jgi:hypothetical protein
VKAHYNNNNNNNNNNSDIIGCTSKFVGVLPYTTRTSCDHHSSQLSNLKRRHDLATVHDWVDCIVLGELTLASTTQKRLGVASLARVHEAAMHPRAVRVECHDHRRAHLCGARSVGCRAVHQPAVVESGVSSLHWALPGAKTTLLHVITQHTLRVRPDGQVTQVAITVRAARKPDCMRFAGACK